jgi:hypothetical protein
MAKSTLPRKISAGARLEDQIETIRKDAYQEGYAAAMQGVLAFTTPVKAPARAPAKSKAKAPTKPAAKGAAKPAVQAGTRRRGSRGSNATSVADALKGLPEQTGRGADIRKSLSANGITMAFTSIRHSLNQLQARGEATLDPDGKTWHAINA